MSPPLVTYCIGEIDDDGERRHVVVEVSSVERKVTGRRILFESEDQGWAEMEYERLQYDALFRGEKPPESEVVRRQQLCHPYKGQDITKGWGLGMTRPPGREQGWVIYRIEFEGNRLTEETVEGTARYRDDAFGHLKDLQDRLIGTGNRIPFSWSQTPKVRTTN